MKIRPTVAIGLAAIAALTTVTHAQGGGPDGTGLTKTDFVGPLIDGNRSGPSPTLRWSSFDTVTAGVARNTIDHFGSSVIARRFGQATAWGTLSATAGDTFTADLRLPGVESADFHTLSARSNTPTDNYAVMLRFETGAMTHNDVLTIGQLFRDSATAMSSARINASYQGVTVALSNFEIFNMDLTVAGSGFQFLSDLKFNALTGSYNPTANGSNSDYLMFRPLAGVLVDKIDIFIDSTRPNSIFTDRVDIGLGAFVVPAPGSAAVLGVGLIGACRRRRR